MERKFFHFSDLEEFHDGMWRIQRGVEREIAAQASASLMREPKQFKAAMMQALEQWPNSCFHNLTMENGNRLAWLGHAGCCIEKGSPEENTRLGWHMLSKKEQDIANEMASLVLNAWLDANSETQELPLFKNMWI